MEILTDGQPDGRFIYIIPEINTAEYNRLGLIITRLDVYENIDPVGEYTIVLKPTTHSIVKPLRQN